MAEEIEAPRIRSRPALAAALLATPLLTSCQGDLPSASTSAAFDAGCTVPEEFLVEGGPGRDGIPALTDPVLAAAGGPETDYLSPDDRVIGIEIDGRPVAVPHRVLWWHEIVNLDVEGRRVAVTFCPLTGSSLAFDRSAVEGAEFGVSGLLYLNNLVLYDRRDGESLWSQMDRTAVCGPRTGASLKMVPVLEMTWEGWRELHPDTRVPGNVPDAGQEFANYRYPYGAYEEKDNDWILFPQPEIDRRRPPKERVLGIAFGGDRPIAFPFGELDAAGVPVAVREIAGGRVAVVFWDSSRRAAMAYRPHTDDLDLTFRADGGVFVDEQTGSEWTVEGRAVEGPLAGERLEPLAEAHVAFWFAWAAFHPHTRLWEAGS